MANATAVKLPKNLRPEINGANDNLEAVRNAFAEHLGVNVELLHAMQHGAHLNGNNHQNGVA